MARLLVGIQRIAHGRGRARRRARGRGRSAQSSKRFSAASGWSTLALGERPPTSQRLSCWRFFERGDPAEAAFGRARRLEEVEVVAHEPNDTRGKRGRRAGRPRSRRGPGSLPLSRRRAAARRPKVLDRRLPSGRGRRLAASGNAHPLRGGSAGSGGRRRGRGGARGDRGSSG